MSETYLWVLFAIVGVGTFLLRGCFILLPGSQRQPVWLNRALHYVPASVLAALVFPALIKLQAEGLEYDWHRLLAALVAALVAWKSKNMLLTLGAGMGVLWGAQFIA
ncbi:MAG: branched-subunit amino acid transport protein [Motiliproteus sp.]|jgi:branched-subunit amino acid transport protein